jgi:hypothetical protein
VANASKKTIRFTQVVRRAGEPQVHTLWLPPDQDPELRRAQKAHRVMTILPGSTGGKADVGIVGFQENAGQHPQFLIFPKSLKPFDGARVVGIKFDLVAQPKLASVDAVKSAGGTKRVRGPRGKPEPASPLSPRAKAQQPVPPKADVASARETNLVRFEPPQAEVEREPAAPTSSSRQPGRASTRSETDAPARPRPESELIRAIRAAMKDLQRGKSVAAYQRLERVVSRTTSGR